MGNPKISVITPTVRPKGLKLVEKALKQQSFTDFEWIVQGREGKIEGNAWTLNQDYNIALKKAKGKLIVSWQDWTYAKPDALQKFWDHYQRESNAIVSGVGNKYADDSWTVVTWKDPREREDNGSYYPCYYSDIEWNFCAIPRDAISAVGGFDEQMDAHYGMDGYSVLDRTNIIGGWEYYLDQTNKTYSLEHGRPDGWNENNWIGDPYKERHILYVDNPKLPYLD